MKRRQLSESDFSDDGSSSDSSTGTPPNRKRKADPGRPTQGEKVPRESSLSAADAARQAQKDHSSDEASKGMKGRRGRMGSDLLSSEDEDGELEETPAERQRQRPPPRAAGQRAKDQMLSDSDSGFSSDEDPPSQRRGGKPATPNKRSRWPAKKPKGRPRKIANNNNSDDSSLSGNEGGKSGQNQRRKTSAPAPKPNLNLSSDDDSDIDGYGSDLIGDEEDRERLMALPEVEREQILSERYEKRKEAQERRALGKKLKQQGKTFPTQPKPDERKKSVYSDFSSSEDEGEFTSSRQKGQASNNKQSSSKGMRKKDPLLDSSDEDDALGSRSKRNDTKARKAIDSDSDFSVGSSSKTPAKKGGLSDSDFSLSGSEAEDSKAKNELKKKTSGLAKNNKMGFSSTNKFDSDSDDSSDFGAASRKKSSLLAGKTNLDSDDESSALDTDDDEDEDATSKRRREALRKMGKNKRGLDDDDDDDNFGMSSDEDDYKDKSSEQDEEEDTREPELNDLNLARIPRMFLEKWVNEPFFKPAVCGSFVRLGIGTNSRNVPIYRICRIADVIPYRLHYKVGKQTCNKALVLEHGKSKRHFRMDNISNHRFNSQEFQQWLLRMKDERLKLPSPTVLSERHKEMKSIVSGHKYTEDEINKMVDTNISSGKGLKNAGRSKEILRAELELAKENNDEDKVEFLEKKLSQLRAEEDQKKKFLRAKAKGWASINKRNVNQNFKVDVSYGNKKAAELTKRLESGTGDTFDPFARRATRPKVLWVTKGTAGGDSEGVEESKGDGGPKEEENGKKMPLEGAKEKANPKPFDPSAILDAVYDDLDDSLEPAKNLFKEKLVPDPKHKKKADISKKSDPSKRQGLSLKEYLSRARAHHVGEA